MTSRIAIAAAALAALAAAAPAQQTPPPAPTPPADTPPPQPSAAAPQPPPPAAATTTTTTTPAPPAPPQQPMASPPAPPAPSAPPAPPAAAADSGRPFTVELTGAAERPGPGDADGTGTAQLRVNPGLRQVCYTLTVAHIDAATLAHIHRGAVNVAGPVVVNFDPPAGGSSQGCVAVERSLAEELIRSPAGFYVNVHNAAFPNGAIRGQLSR